MKNDKEKVMRETLSCVKEETVGMENGS